jgi:alpha-tubulin suppressor-like RCC1 family protein
LKSFLLTVVPKPDDLKGTITCNPSNSKNRAANQFVLKAGSDVTLANIVCSGIVDPDGDTVVYSLTGTCFSQGLGIVAASGKLSGTMPALSGGAPCSGTVSAVAGLRPILASQRKNISIYNGQLLSASLQSPSFTADDQCKINSGAAASYSGQGSFADATATSSPAGFGTLVATNNSWSGILQDFNPSSYTLQWNVTSNATDTLTATSSMTLIKTPLVNLNYTPADGTLANLTTEGIQANFNFPTTQCSSKTQCSQLPRSLVAAGEDGSCFVNDTGTLSCFGSNNSNNLGTAVAGPFGVATGISGLVDVRAVSLGKEHGCALTADKKVYCWGSNTYGQLGLGDQTSRSTPTLVTSLSNVVSLSVGDHHSCALLSTGSVNCWGRNNRGQLGVSSMAFSELPNEVPNVSKAKLMSAGAGHTCVFSNTGTAQFLKCWGDNSTDQLGLGQTVEFSADAQEVQAVSFTDYGNVRALGAGGQETNVAGIYSGHTCVSMANGDVMCWGNNADGQLGSGSAVPSKTNGTSTAIIVKKDALTPLGSNASIGASLSLGGAHSCALVSDRSVWCWGRNTMGQLGIGNTNATYFASKVTAFGAGSDVLGVSAGKEHTCYLRWGGEVNCAGNQLGGRLGNNNTGAGNQSTPVQVLVPTTFTPASARYQKCEAISL